MIDIVSVAALVLSLTGNVLINYRKRIGFIAWFASNVLWITVNVMGKVNLPMIAMFVVYMVFNAHGWLKWRKAR